MFVQYQIGVVVVDLVGFVCCFWVESMYVGIGCLEYFYQVLVGCFVYVVCVWFECQFLQGNGFVGEFVVKMMLDQFEQFGFLFVVDLFDCVQQMCFVVMCVCGVFECLYVFGKV